VSTSETEVESVIESLGEVTAPSGVLLIIDTGYLNLWCHDRPPVLPEGVLSNAQATARANTFVDVRVDGPDAVEAGKAFDRSWNPLYVFDASPESVGPGGKLTQAFAEIVSARSLRARLVPQSLIPHRRRVDLALEYGSGAGEVQFHGLWAAVIAVPNDRALPVMGVRIVDGDFAGRWQRVWVECGNGRVARSEMAGHVMVDWARLMVADVDGLGEWKHDEPLDGRADIGSRVRMDGPDGQPVRWLFREAPDREADSGWRVFAGDETDEYNDDYRNISLIGVGQLVQRDAALKAVIDAEPGAAFERRDPDEAFVPVKNWTPRGD
jgi:hypothetical protein